MALREERVRVREVQAVAALQLHACAHRGGGGGAARAVGHGVEPGARPKLGDGDEARGLSVGDGGVREGGNGGGGGGVREMLEVRGVVHYGRERPLGGAFGLYAL